MNHSILTGRLVKEVELSYLPDGKPKATFTIAVNRPFVNTQGEREADFIRCVAWSKTAENLANFTTKGSKIGIQGRIQTGSYQNQQGQKVFTTDIVVNEIEFLDPKNANVQNGQQSVKVQQGHQQSVQQNQQGVYQQHAPMQQGYQQQQGPMAQSSANVQYAVDQNLPF